MPMRASRLSLARNAADLLPPTPVVVESALSASVIAASNVVSEKLGPARAA